ncbi:MAG: hypothetical protein AAB436_01535 [Patescibacteria group bacterium]
MSRPIKNKNPDQGAFTVQNHYGGESILPEGRQFRVVPLTEPVEAATEPLVEPEVPAGPKVVEANPPVNLLQRNQDLWSALGKLGTATKNRPAKNVYAEERERPVYVETMIRLHGEDADAKIQENSESYDRDMAQVDNLFKDIWGLGAALKSDMKSKEEVMAMFNEDKDVFMEQFFQVDQPKINMTQAANARAKERKQLNKFRDVSLDTNTGGWPSSPKRDKQRATRIKAAITRRQKAAEKKLAKEQAKATQVADDHDLADAA